MTGVLTRAGLKDAPKKLKPYLFHGVELGKTEGEGQAVGDCPFCGREGKFAVDKETGLWNCRVCRSGSRQGGGNVYTFLRLLHEASPCPAAEAAKLAADRRMLSSEAVERWGCVISLLDGVWLVPGYNAEGKITQLYRYDVADRATGRRALLATPELSHGIHRPAGYDPKRGDVWVFEGVWDGAAADEARRGSPQPAAANVLAVPGANVFDTKWQPLFAGKRVYLLYDSDRPRENRGTVTWPVGYEWMRRAARVLAEGSDAPAEILYLRWGPDGYDPELPDGYDVRDHLSRGASAAVRTSLMGRLLGRCVPAPADWLVAKGRTGGKGGTDLECVECTDWNVLRDAWRKALRWTEGLDRALSVMLAAVISTEAVGDQLWVKIIGPAACGKSTLCEALSVTKKYVLAKSTIRGFHSGFQLTRDAAEDNSLLAQLKGKTLVTKDGDTLLQSPNLGQILAEARDVYDRVSRTHYRNKASKDYEGVSMTWLLCGTSSLRSIDSSELGERFLDCVIVEDIDDELEDEIGWRVANRAEREVAFVSNGRAETREGPEMTKAKQLTGGYVEHLRANAPELISAVHMPEPALRLCMKLAKFVAFMRARPSKRQEEKEEREMSFRLISQHVRLAKCLAAVLNRREVDAEVMRRVRRVALDTARGRVLDLTGHLYRAGEEGISTRVLGVLTGRTEEKERDLLRFLKSLGAAEAFQTKAKGMAPKVHWRLAPKIRRLYEELVLEK